MLAMRHSEKRSVLVWDKQKNQWVLVEEVVAILGSCFLLAGMNINFEYYTLTEKEKFKIKKQKYGEYLARIEGKKNN